MAGRHKMTRMTIGKKLMLGFIGLALLVGVVGFYGLNASNQIARSFEGGEEHFRSIVIAATEASSYTKRAEGHLALYLALHDEVDREKFFQRYASLLEQIEILDERVKIPEARAILDKIKSGTDEILIAGEALLEAYDKDMESAGRFEFEQHKELVLKMYSAASAIRKYGVELADFETDFLNKQAVITAATEASSYVKRAEGHLTLYLTLHDEADREKFFQRYASLLEQIEILDERVKIPEARAILDKIKSGTDEILIAGEALFEAYDKDMESAGRFEFEQHKELVLKVYSAASAIRGHGVELAILNIALEADAKKTAIANAASIQRNIFIVMIAAIIVALGLAYFISRTISNPVTKLRNAAIDIGKGDLTKRAEVKSKDEIGELASSFNRMTDEIQKRDEKLKTVNEELRCANEELQATEEELRASNEEMTAANEELKETQDRLIRSERLAAIGQLAGGVGHELRNPLGAIKNAVYYIKGKLSKSDMVEKEPRVLEFLDIMDDEIDGSNRIISDLLGFSRVGKPAVALTPVKKIIADAMARVPIPENVELNENFGPDSAEIAVDSEQIQQVLVNVINNAVQAMPKGGRLTVSTREKNGFLELDVIDTGSGIAAEDKGKIFEPLFTTKAKGIGLGLAVSKSIIDRHGGQIEAESVVGKGTTFTIRLPLKTPVQEESIEKQ